MNIAYNLDYLNNTNIFTPKELELLEAQNSILSLQEFFKNINYIEVFGFDFIYTNAKIEGNSYTKAEALTLLENRRTSSKNRLFTDAIMLMNLEKAYEYILKDDGVVAKEKICKIHSILSNNLLEVHELGAVRKKEVFVHGSKYKSSNDVKLLNSELERVIDICNNIENPYNKAMYLHNNLAYLQYFQRFNKQTARVVLNLPLIACGKMILIPDEVEFA